MLFSFFLSLQFWFLYLFKICLNKSALLAKVLGIEHSFNAGEYRSFLSRCYLFEGNLNSFKTQLAAISLSQTQNHKCN